MNYLATVQQGYYKGIRINIAVERRGINPLEIKFKHPSVIILL